MTENQILNLINSHIETYGYNDPIVEKFIALNTDYNSNTIDFNSYVTQIVLLQEKLEKQNNLPINWDLI